MRERQRPPLEEIADLGPDAVRPGRTREPAEQRGVGPLQARRQLLRVGAAQPALHARLRHRHGHVRRWPARHGAARGARTRSSRRRYRIGGGALGNVNAEHADVARPRARVHRERDQSACPRRAARIARSIDEAKNRAPYTIKSRDRAVTSEDYEMLALRASTHARARAVRAGSQQPRARHARARAQGRAARRGSDAPARALERGAALRQALPRRSQARRHGAQRGAAALQGPVAARRADPPHASAPAIGCARTSSSSCAGSCTRWSAARTARAGSSAARCSRPS